MMKPMEQSSVGPALAARWLLMNVGPCVHGKISISGDHGRRLILCLCTCDGHCLLFILLDFVYLCLYHDFHTNVSKEYMLACTMHFGTIQIGYSNTCEQKQTED